VRSTFRDARRACSESFAATDAYTQRSFVDVWHDDEKENRPPGDKVLTQHP
jgi:hypothetical protein